MYYIGDIITYIKSNDDYIVYSENYLLFYHFNLKSIKLLGYNLSIYKELFKQKE